MKYDLYGQNCNSIFFHNMEKLSFSTKYNSWLDIVVFNSTTQSQLLTTLGKKPFEKIVGKGENVGNQHFLLFPQSFLPN